MIFKSRKSEAPINKSWFLESAKAIASYSTENYRVLEKEAHKDNHVDTRVIRMGINGILQKEDARELIKVTDGAVVDLSAKEVYSKGALVSMDNWKSGVIIAPLGAKIISYKPDNDKVAKDIEINKEYAPSAIKAFYAMSVLSKLTIS